MMMMMMRTMTIWESKISSHAHERCLVFRRIKTSVLTSNAMSAEADVGLFRCFRVDAIFL